jgi:hypothetical protein
MKLVGTIREFMDADLWETICQYFDDNNPNPVIGGPRTRSSDNTRLEVIMDLAKAEIANIVFLL